MKKILLVILITVLSLGILPSCAVQQNYSCPAIYQLPSRFKSIPTNSRSWQVNKDYAATKKKQKKSVERASRTLKR